MDISFSANPQTLISSVSISQFHLPNLVRRHFLGGGIHSKRPGLLRSRNKIKKLGFPRFNSPKCIHQDSVQESTNSMLVIAVSFLTVAIIQLVYLDYSQRRRDDTEFSDKRGSDGVVCGELQKQDRDVTNEEAAGSHLLGCESHSMEHFERDITLEGTHENEKVIASCMKDDNQAEFQAGDLSWEEILSNEVSNEVQRDHELWTLTPVDDVLLTTIGVEGLISPSKMINKVKATEHIDFAAKVPDFLAQRDEALAVSDASVAFVEHDFSFSSPSLEKNNRDINQYKYQPEDIESHSDEIMVSSITGHLRAIDKEVSDCCDERQTRESMVMSPSCHESLSTEPYQFTIEDDNAYRSNGSLLTKGGPEGQALIEYFKEASVSKEIEFPKSLRFTDDNGKIAMNRNDRGKSSSFLKQNGFVRDGNNSSGYLKTYGRMLRDARLRDCLDVLEDMDRKGLLNMDKVHHTSFLKACKSQKAVKEAFQFCKLIRKPTLSTFNMLLSVCANSQNFDGAFQVMLLVKEAGLNPDCKLYTTLISTCAKSGKVDAMFEVFHEMVNAGVEPNVNTYGALIDGCARAGQVPKAFGAYGILRSKKVQPDRVIFNALITACGQSGAVDRAFDVLAEMGSEPKRIDPDHFTVGALMKTCIQAGQVDRVREVYKMLQIYKIKGTPDVYTIAVNSCSQTGDLEFALSIYDDMRMNGVIPDEMFLSTIIDVAGHAGKVDAAFEILKDAKTKGIPVGSFSYSSLMGACCNAKDWKKALELYEDIKSIKLLPTVSTLNALITSLADGGELQKAVEVLDEIKEAGVCPNIVTYSILIVACEKKDEAELGFLVLSRAKKDGILPNLIMCRCLTGLCLRSLEKARSLGEPIVTFISGKPQIDSEWTSRAITVYRETISAGVIPTIEAFSQVLGCLQFPHDSSLKDQFIENLGFNFDTSKCSTICSLFDGFGEYDTRCFSVLEEATSLGVIPRASFKESTIVVDSRKLLVHTVEVYILTILKGLKHRLAAGARLPTIIILLPTEKAVIASPTGERTIGIAGRVGQAVGSLLRRLGLRYSGDVSYGKIRIMGLALRRWLKPKLDLPSSSARPGEMISAPIRIAKGISDQQRDIRCSNNLSVE